MNLYLVKTNYSNRNFYITAKSLSHLEEVFVEYTNKSGTMAPFSMRNVELIASVLDKSVSTPPRRDIENYELILGS